VFGNDMAAYFAGSLWGGSTRLGLPVSPQKSIVGFIAGVFGTLLVVITFHLAAPDFLPFGLPLKLLLGFGMGVLIILGDLVESGLKRSAGVKDSGIVIPGRGGVLDSVDSMLLSAPFLYYFLIIVRLN
jgi:phosphatidate cytidylyltransferase